MTKAMKRLAADLLDAYADRLGNAGCNDWTYPAWMTPGNRLTLARACSEDDREFCATDEFGPPDFAVAIALRDMLREEAK